jgi:hypothetical protein
MRSSAILCPLVLLAGCVQYVEVSRPDPLSSRLETEQAAYLAENDIAGDLMILGENDFAVPLGSCVTVIRDNGGIDLKRIVLIRVPADCVANSFGASVPASGFIAMVERWQLRPLAKIAAVESAPSP